MRTNALIPTAMPAISPGRRPVLRSSDEAAGGDESEESEVGVTKTVDTPAAAGDEAFALVGLALEVQQPVWQHTLSAGQQIPPCAE